MNKFEAFAIGVFISTALWLCFLLPAQIEVKNLPFVYETCTNFPGLQSTCTTRARFEEEYACTLYAVAAKLPAESSIYNRCRK